MILATSIDIEPTRVTNANQNSAALAPSKAIVWPIVLAPRTVHEVVTFDELSERRARQTLTHQLHTAFVTDAGHCCKVLSEVVAHRIYL